MNLKCKILGHTWSKVVMEIDTVLVMPPRIKYYKVCLRCGEKIYIE